MAKNYHGFLYNYNDPFVFLSTANKNVTKFYSDMGFNKWANSFTYDSNSSPFFESIMSIKHIMTLEDKNNYIEIEYEIRVAV